MTELEAALRVYYDHEAGERVARPVDPLRVEQRRLFAAQLRSEQRRKLLDVGVGPGRDAVAFASAGFDVVGVDLSYQNARLASVAGLPALQANVYDLPFPMGHFDAGWTMSTLLHVPDPRFDEAMRSIAAALGPGAPLAIGLWGGPDQEGVSDRTSPPRLFSLRSHKRIREMLSHHGRLERFESWGRDGVDWQYQFAVLRVR